MAKVLAAFSVPDWEKWKMVYDAAADARRAAGGFCF
jgi:hypothetical protein